MPELPGIFNWMLDGLKKYQRIGLQPPSSVSAATEEYRKDMDLIGLWIEDCCDHDKTSDLVNATLYRSYSQWAELEVGFTMTAITFGRCLSDRGFQKVSIDHKRGYRGLRLRVPPPRF